MENSDLFNVVLFYLIICLLYKSYTQYSEKEKKEK